MNKVTITVNLNGREVSRNYTQEELSMDIEAWGVQVCDMLSSLNEAEEQVMDEYRTDERLGMI